MIRIPGVQETPPSVVSLQAPLPQQVQQTDGLQMLGQLTSTMASQANRFAALGRQGVRNARVSMAKEGQVRAAQEINRLLDDRENGFLRKQGAAARDGIQDFEKALDEAQKKLTAGIEDPEARKMFEQATAVDFARARTAAGIHWSKQSQVANAAQSKVRFGQVADDVAAGDWDARVDLRKEIDEYGQLVGLSPEQRDALYKDTLSAAEATFVDTLITEAVTPDDYDKVEEELEKHGDALDRNTRAKLRERMRKNKQQAEREAKVEAEREEREARAEQNRTLTSELMDRALFVGPQQEGYVQSTAEEMSEVVRFFDLLEEHKAANADFTDEDEAAVRRDYDYRTKRANFNKNAELMGNMEAVESYIRENPGSTTTDIEKALPKETAYLKQTDEGRSLFQDVVKARAADATEAGKEHAAQVYINAHRAVNEGQISSLFPQDPVTGKISGLEVLSVLTPEQQVSLRKAITDYYEPEKADEKNRLALNQRVKAMIEAQAENRWARIGNNRNNPIDLRVVDVIVSGLNKSLPPDATFDQQQEAVERAFKQGYAFGDSRIPYGALRFASEDARSDAQLETRNGSVIASQVPGEVKDVLRSVVKQEDKRELSELQIERESLSLWVSLNKPTDADALRKQLKEGFEAGGVDSNVFGMQSVRKTARLPSMRPEAVAAFAAAGATTDAIRTPQDYRKAREEQREPIPAEVRKARLESMLQTFADQIARREGLEDSTGVMAQLRRQVAMLEASRGSQMSTRKAMELKTR
jgi:hypothetical protein